MARLNLRISDNVKEHMSTNPLIASISKSFEDWYTNKYMDSSNLRQELEDLFKKAEYVKQEIKELKKVESKIPDELSVPELNFIKYQISQRLKRGISWDGIRKIYNNEYAKQYTTQQLKLLFSKLYESEPNKEVKLISPKGHELFFFREDIPFMLKRGNTWESITAQFNVQFMHSYEVSQIRNFYFSVINSRGDLTGSEANFA